MGYPYPKFCLCAVWGPYFWGGWAKGGLRGVQGCGFGMVWGSTYPWLPDAFYFRRYFLSSQVTGLQGLRLQAGIMCLVSHDHNCLGMSCVLLGVLRTEP